jgi:hypothetical protein
LKSNDDDRRAPAVLAFWIFLICARGWPAGGFGTRIVEARFSC